MIVPATAVSGAGVRVRRLLDASSISTVEAQVFLLAMDKVAQSAHDSFLVLCDSLSCLKTIQNPKFSNPLVLECQAAMTVVSVMDSFHMASVMIGRSLICEELAIL
jgi:hypothetical protein